MKNEYVKFTQNKTVLTEEEIEHLYNVLKDFYKKKEYALVYNGTDFKYEKNKDEDLHYSDWRL